MTLLPGIQASVKYPGIIFLRSSEEIATITPAKICLLSCFLVVASIMLDTRESFKLRRVLQLADIEEKKSPLELNNHILSKVILQSIGGVIGGIVALLVYFGAFWFVGYKFPPLYLLATFVLGAIFGAFFADLSSRWLKSRLWIMIIAAFSGLVATFCLVELFFLVLGSGDF